MKNAAILKRQWLEMDIAGWEPLTLGELKVGDRFIVFPIPGDNSGHGGFRRGSWLFTVKEKGVTHSEDQPYSPEQPHDRVADENGVLGDEPQSLFVLLIPRLQGTMSTDIDWAGKIREVLKPDSDEDCGRGGDTPTSRLADEIANRCGSNPFEAMRVIEALFAVTREVAEKAENRLLSSGRLAFLSQYVLAPGPLINLAVPPRKK